MRNSKELEFTLTLNMLIKFFNEGNSIKKYMLV